MAFFSVLICHIAWADAQPALTIVAEVPEVFLTHNIGMVPLQPLAAMLDASVTLEAQQHAIMVSCQGKRFTCALGSVKAQANGHELTLPATPFDCGGVSYLPLRPLVEALGGQLDIAQEGRRAVLALNSRSYTLHVSFVPGPLECTSALMPSIYLANLDGTSLARLTYTAEPTLLPVLSPDGSRLIFRRHNDPRLYQRLVGEYYATPLCGGQGETCGDVRFSPDGSTLFFTQRNNSGAHIGKMTLLKNGTCSTLQGDGAFPCCSPDGQTIAFTAAEPGSTRTWVSLMRSDGTQRRRLTTGEQPVFSPNGQYLLFMRNDDVAQGTMADLSKRLAIYVLHGDKQGTIYEQLPGNTPLLQRANEGPGSFSPDSMRLAFSNGGIRVMAVDRSGMRQLTNNPLDLLPRFTPDGTRVLFTRQDAPLAPRLLYVMLTDGSAPQVLIPGLSVIDYAITPDGRHLLLMGLPVQGGGARK